MGEQLAVMGMGKTWGLSAPGIALFLRFIAVALLFSGLIGISVSDYISRLTGFYLRPVFVFLLGISNGFWVKVEEGKSYPLSYGRGEGFLKLTKEAMENA